MKDAVLGKDYELSVAVVTPTAMRAVNRRYRGKDHATDILSFPLTNQSGEMMFCVAEIRSRAPDFGRTVANFTSFLFIHGLLHLKGFRHGSTMERQEQKFRRLFKI